MNKDIEHKLEFDRVRAEVASYTLSYLGRQHAERMSPLTDVARIEQLLRETDEARSLVDTGSSVPIPTLEGVERTVGLLGKGYILDEREISAAYTFLHSTKQLKRYLERKYDLAPRACAYAYSLHDVDALMREIERCIEHGRVADMASAELGKVRKKIATTTERLKKKLDAILHKYRAYLQESVVSIRSGRYVVPVKKEHKRLVSGAILDESASGQTVFIEPADIQQLQSELTMYQALEEQEVAKVLSFLTGLLEAEQPALLANLEVVGYCDFLFAKAKYAHAIAGRSVVINRSGQIHIHGGRHPLLAQGSMPLEFSIGAAWRALMITGPNTGGKTVCLKTVGLLTLMVQSGLLVPVGEGSEFAIFTEVLADIGDGQSIEHSLSTFSAHIQSVIHILQHVGPRTLVLLDELATGTDPGEGVGLSIAILEELYRRGATVVATTHFNEIKEFAARTPGFENARMEFDVATLKPLYRLKIGEAGLSYAFQIALQLGIPERIVARSREVSRANGHTSTVPLSRQSFVPDKTGDAAVEPPAEEPAVGQAQGAQGDTRRGTTVRRQESAPYQVGDRVWIHAWRKSGIVCELPDEKGNLGVIVQKQKHTINQKRVSPYLSRQELYPENYDLDIVLESKQVRKQRKLMGRRHVPGLTIDHDSPNGE